MNADMFYLFLIAHTLALMATAVLVVRDMAAGPDWTQRRRNPFR